ncbi:MAG TPA: hypothetical protein VHU80_02150 [Polyangiaceae bacterium]|jgi:hypothetical protein|nr:hypothetical protein [Polyangiaceae bacterium]
MRWKIIIVNSGIVAIVALLSFVLLYTSLHGMVADPAARKSEVEHAIRGANAQLELDGLLLERWLAEQAARPEVRGVFAGGTERARSDSATAQADKIRELASANPMFSHFPPALVLFVDAQGVALGRNGSALMRGDKIADVYPILGEALKAGHTTSDVWLNRERQEQLLSSYAPVRGDDGVTIGGIIIGTPLNDERLSRTSDLTSGQALVFGMKGQGDKIELIAKSEQASADVLGIAQSGAVLDAAQASLGSGNLTIVSGASKDYLAATAPVSGYGAGSNAVLVALVPASLVSSIGGVLWPVFAVAGLGILLVFAGGTVLGNYISTPISEVEEGLLQIINGKTDLRFELEHDDLGGLISRINSLLNALTGVPETDEEGRTSTAPEQPYQE